MNDEAIESSVAGPSGNDHSLLFGQLVLQQSQMALIFLGKVPNPETGKTEPNLDAARVFIDQLEMLEAKTKGNLNKQEEMLLKQTLMPLRLAFVEAVEGAQTSAPAEPETSHAQPPGQAGPGAGGAPPAGSPAQEESRKKFSKKY
jgi:hypothetical protein